MTPARVLVLGAGGMLGHKMFQKLRESCPGTMGTVRRGPAQGPTGQMEFLQGNDVLPGPDASDAAGVRKFLRTLRPGCIINCIGVIKQRDEAKDPQLCIAINALFPHLLATTAAEWGCRLIHFSTDCVFSGRQGNYREDDPTDAEDLYGRTKALGEVSTANALTLRTSIIGRELTHHRSLLDWFLAQEGGTVPGYTRVTYSGVTTLHLAGLVATIVADHPGLQGLYQVSSRPVSKYELLLALRDAYGVPVEIIPDNQPSSDRSLCGDKLRRAIGYECPTWRDLASQLASDTTPYPQLPLRKTQ